ncbi:MAG: hypothetical protein H6R15_1197 [Proteobacteria bacterium]|nr:hypothetical protein [Pseudomonadota bacterium]
MRRFFNCRVLICISLALSVSNSPIGAAELGNTAAIRVKVEGQVIKAGVYSLPPHSRLVDAALSGGVRADAYLPGATWLHQPAKASQQELKIGLIHDLTVFIRNAKLDNLPESAALGLRLRNRVESMPTTGRLVNALDPIRLELDSKANHLLADGDELYYPARPEIIIVQGAVTQDCVLPFVSQKVAADYARACPQHGEAETDWVYIIEPNGSTRLHTIAAWNAEKAQALLPGSQLLVPLRSRPGQPTDELNTELARFLATQVLPTQGQQP